MGRHPAHEDGIRIGGPRDPVAQSIRREQQADAAPSASEVKAEHRKRLASKGCQVCDEDDPDHLSEVPIPLKFCSNDQHPPEPFDTVVLCDEHERPGRVLGRARMVQKARRDGADVIATYDCGAYIFESWDVPDDDELAKRNPRLADDDFDSMRLRTKVMVASPPKVPAFHVGRGVCGADLDEVIILD